MQLPYLSRKGYTQLSPNAATRVRQASTAKADTYGARFKAMIVPITQLGGLATLAALHLPLAAMRSRSAFETVPDGAPRDTSLAAACFNGLVFGLTAPVALGLASLFVVATLGAYAVCVPYAAFRSLPASRSNSTVGQDND